MCTETRVVFTYCNTHNNRFTRSGKHVKWCTILLKVLPFLFSMSTITILNCYITTKENKVTRKKQEGFQYFTVNTKPLAKSHNRVR